MTDEIKSVPREKFDVHVERSGGRESTEHITLVPHVDKTSSVPAIPVESRPQFGPDEIVLKYCRKCRAQIIDVDLCGYSCELDSNPHPEEFVEEVRYVRAEPVGESTTNKIEEAVQEISDLTPYNGPSAEIIKQILNKHFGVGESQPADVPHDRLLMFFNLLRDSDVNLEYIRELAQKEKSNG